MQSATRKKLAAHTKLGTSLLFLMDILKTFFAVRYGKNEVAAAEVVLTSSHI